MTKTKFIGEAGEHFVAYKLARKEMYVGLTIGNMPHIDLLVSSKSALKSISIQVKSSQNAYRKNRYGYEGYEWNVNRSAIGSCSTNFWYVFVDLKGATTEPDVYIIPSKWVAEFVKEEWSRYMYFLPQKAADLTRNRWDFLEKILDNNKDIIDFASKWNDEILIHWGG